MTKEAQELHELVVGVHEALEEDRKQSESHRSDPESEAADERTTSADPGPIDDTPIDRLWQASVLHVHRSTFERRRDGVPGAANTTPILRLAIALFAAMALLFVLFALVFSSGFFGDDETDSKPADGSSDANSDVAVEQDNSATEAADADSVAPLSGTWTMYFRNSEGSERPGFTLRFNGVDSGTVEVLNDDTESATSFTLVDSGTSQLTVAFTRSFFGEYFPAEGWPEKSTFAGAERADGTFTGTWKRQGWECHPDTGCAYTGRWTSFDAWLVQEP